MSSLKWISRIVQAIATSDGAGVSLFRSIGSGRLRNLDPFLLLDAFGTDDPDQYIAGFPNHPHRGFETVTYMIEGNMRHKDSKGNEGLLTSGGIQWMTAGSGVIHSEMPEQEEGRMFGFQLWVNLPHKLKMCPPRYQNIPSEEIPEVTLDSLVQVRVIAGESCGLVGPIHGISVDPTYLDVTLPPNTEFTQVLNQGHRGFVYGMEGGITVGQDTVKVVKLNQLGILSEENEVVTIRNGNDSETARVLLIAGQPIGEPIVHVGPFVMCTEEEIHRAFADYRNGVLDMGMDQ